MTGAIQLHFDGPYQFLVGRKYLFTCKYADRAGIYVWVIRDTLHEINYVHYVGETSGFAHRHREHAKCISGLDYSIVDASAARNGDCRLVWDGLWRDRTPAAVGNMFAVCESVAKHVREYVKLIDVYLAPIDCDTWLRRHIEGCLGYYLREKHPELTKFYAADNRIGRGKTRQLTLQLTYAEPIAGLPDELQI